MVKKKEKGDAINDTEFTDNVLMLIYETMNFAKSNTTVAL